MVKISVIVPVFNAEKHIKNTLNALVEQTLDGTEIILVDDGSTDASANICDSIAATDGRFRVIHKCNGGVSSARNAGINASNGKYIMFCDADDISHSNQAEVLFAKAEAENADVTLCGFVKQNAKTMSKEVLPYTNSIADFNDAVNKLIMPMCVWNYAPKNKAALSVYGSVWRGLYKKSFLINNNISFSTETGLGEDMLFNMLAFAKSKKTAFVSECLYTYVENADSVTHTDSQKLWSKYIVTWQLAHKILQQINVSEEDLRWHNFQLTRYAVSAVIEGVCPLLLPINKKSALVKGILKNAALKQAIKNLPVALGKKDRLLCLFLSPKVSAFTAIYYQIAYNTKYRR